MPQSRLVCRAPKWGFQTPNGVVELLEPRVLLSATALLDSDPLTYEEDPSLQQLEEIEDSSKTKGPKKTTTDTSDSPSLAPPNSGRGGGNGGGGGTDKKTGGTDDTEPTGTEPTDTEPTDTDGDAPLPLDPDNPCLVLYSGEITPDLTSWQVVDGTWNITNDKLEVATPGTAASTHLSTRVVYASTLSEDFFIQVDSSVLTGASSGQHDFAVIFGYQDPNNYYYFSSSESNQGNTNGIFRVANGQSTELIDIPPTISPDIVYQIQVERAGDQIMAYRDGELVGSVSDTTFMTGQIGFGTMNDRAVFEKLTVVGTEVLLLPQPPSNLATSVASSSHIDLSWSDNSTNEAGFRIERSTNGTSWTQIATVDADTTSYSATGLDAGTQYHFRVRAYNDAGDSVYSNTAAATTAAAQEGVYQFVLINADTNTELMTLMDGAVLNLATFATNNLNIRADVSGSFGSVRFDLNGSQFRIENTAPYAMAGDSDSDYYAWTPELGQYVLVATPFSESGASGTAGQALTINFEVVNEEQPPTTVPTAPSGLAATAASHSRIDLSWTDNSSDESGFRIERSTDGSNWTEIGTVGANVTTFAVIGLNAETTYLFRVRAYNVVGNSAYTASASATTQAAATIPLAPSGLTATEASSNRIDLSWSDNSSNESGFRIERSTDGSSWTQIATVGSNTTSYAATGLSASTQYHFRVRAYNDAGNSTFSNTATATTVEAPTNGAPVLEPGSGWTSATPQPPTVGTGVGSDAMAIARWDVVPYQTFTGQFNVGVVAFHMNGIDRVAFSVNAGPWSDVYEMTLNPQTAGNGWDGVVEYWATLDASKFAQAGPIEIRAIAFPNVGTPRVLEPLYLNVDPDGSVLANRQVRYVSPNGSDSAGDGTAGKPFETIKRAAWSIHQAQGNADNGLIYLLPGNHSWAGVYANTATTVNTYLSVEAAPGAEGQAFITGSNSTTQLNTKFVRIGPGITISTRISGNKATNFWFDGTRFWRSNKFSDSVGPWSGDADDRYFTNTVWENVRGGPVSADLVRNIRIKDIMEDGFQNCFVVFNFDVDGIDRSGWQEYLSSAPHPDGFQLTTSSGNNRENSIIYGGQIVNMTSGQGIIFGGGGTATNFAIVNVLIEMPSDSNLSQWIAPTDHLLIWNMTHVNRSFSFRTLNGVDATLDGGNMTNISIRNSVFHTTSGFTAPTGSIVIDNNHFISGGAVGTNATTGDPIWINATSKDYRPAVNSPLRNRVTQLLVPTDAEGNEIELISGSIGALQPR